MKNNITPTPMKRQDEKIALTPELVRLAGELGKLAALPVLEQPKMPALAGTSVKLCDWPIV